MKATTPADTRMMGIVHGALRRDLVRAREVAGTAPYPVGRQRQALGRHVVWLMDFLHAHHTSEDEGLWPAVRAKAPAAESLLASLEADHQHIQPAAQTLRTAAQQYAESTDEATRVSLVTALDELGVVLFPHLDREVAEAMPVVAASITDAEWRAIERKHNIAPKSLAELGFEGHWLLDGIDEEGYQVVTHTIPAIPRLVLLKGFRRAYRRRVAEVWHPSGHEVGSAAR